MQENVLVFKNKQNKKICFISLTVMQNHYEIPLNKNWYYKFSLFFTYHYQLTIKVARIKQKFDVAISKMIYYLYHCFSEHDKHSTTLTLDFFEIKNH